MALLPKFFQQAKQINALERDVTHHSKVIVDLERAVERIDTDRDDLWERIHRQQAKIASRARRDLAKTPDDPHSDINDIDKAIKDGTYGQSAPN